MKGFGSDNHSGIQPDLLQSIIDCNLNHEPSYGTDPYSIESFQVFKEHFNANIDIHYVYNGTAANVLCMRAGLKRHESILVSDVSHFHNDECGAPEFFAGKVIPVASIHGKIIVSQLEKFLIRKGDQHYSQPKMISITQPTELGTCYSLKEIKEIALIAQKHNLLFHIDGARLSNALYSLKTTFKKMIVNTKVDLLSFGGTKNGFAFGEAIVILNKNLQKDFKFIKKQSAQLPSKSRFIANQFKTYLTKDLYLKIAQHSVDMAHFLYQEISLITAQTNKIILTEQQQSNAVFVILPQEIIKNLRKKHFFYVWNENTYECRLMTSWDTSRSQIQSFISDLKKQLHLETE